jgi:hypothetical protein
MKVTPITAVSDGLMLRETFADRRAALLPPVNHHVTASSNLPASATWRARCHSCVLDQRMLEEIASVRRRAALEDGTEAIPSLMPTL